MDMEQAYTEATEVFRSTQAPLDVALNLLVVTTKLVVKLKEEGINDLTWSREQDKTAHDLGLIFIGLSAAIVESKKRLEKAESKTANLN